MVRIVNNMLFFTLRLLKSVTFICPSVSFVLVASSWHELFSFLFLSCTLNIFLSSISLCTFHTFLRVSQPEEIRSITIFFFFFSFFSFFFYPYQSHYRCCTSWKLPKCLRSRSQVTAGQLSWLKKTPLLSKWSAGAPRVASSVWWESQPTSSCIASASMTPILR